MKNTLLFLVSLSLTMGASLALTNCTNTNTNSSQAKEKTIETKKYFKVKHAKLTENGIEIFKSVKDESLNLKGNLLLAIEGYTMWSNNKRIVLVPNETSEPVEALVSHLERRKYPFPGNLIYTTVCLCSGSLGGSGDDCHFDDSSGSSPWEIECTGRCGCLRISYYESGKTTFEDIIDDLPLL